VWFLRQKLGKTSAQICQRNAPTVVTCYRFIPHPREEEIFSNWILELASANDKSIKEFLNLLQIPLKPRDFETPNDRPIEVLKEVTGSTQNEIALTFPSSFKAVWKKPLHGDRWNSQYGELCAARVTAPHTLFVCA
jgi:hypothetical protein